MPQTLRYVLYTVNDNIQKLALIFHIKVQNQINNEQITKLINLNGTL